MRTPLEDITSGDMTPEERILVQQALRSLRRYVLVALTCLVGLVALGIIIVITQNIASHDQVIHAANTTHSLLHQLQATLAQDKCEIIHGQNYHCPLPK
jgi:hypothetical protein